MKLGLFFLVVIASFSISIAQGDSLSTSHFLKSSYLEGEARNFLMQTTNLNDSDDYYTNASGLFLKWNSGEWKNFKVGVGGRYITKTLSSSIAEADTETENFTKWEFELYDILNRDNFDLFFLEELYFTYKQPKWDLQVGNMLTEDTPLFSRSDGRMRPFHYRGMWFNYYLNSKHQFSFSWLTHVLPRSMTSWLTMNQSIGILTNGYQPNGEQADYLGSFNSRGSGIFKYHFKKEKFDVLAYQFLIHDIIYTNFLQFNYYYKDWTFGIQYLLQKGTTSSKRLAYENRYIQPNEVPQVISFQTSYHVNSYSFQVAYSYALPTGRILFPKELGRDWFFTSTARSRMEGLGDAHNLLLRANYFSSDSSLSLHAEWIQMFGVRMNDFEFNKYNIDSYYQVNFRVRYNLSFLKGLKFDLLYTFKQNYNEHDPINVFNRSDYSQFNFVTLLYF